MNMPTINIIKPNAEILEIEPPVNITESNPTFSALLMELSAGVTDQTRKLVTPTVLNELNTQQLTATNENISSLKADQGNKIVPSTLWVDLPDKQTIMTNEKNLPTEKNILNTNKQSTVEIGVIENLKMHNENIGIETELISKFSASVYQQNITQALKGLNSPELLTTTQMVATAIKPVIQIEKSKSEIQAETSFDDANIPLSQIKKIEKQQQEPVTAKTEIKDKSINNEVARDKTVISQSEGIATTTVTPKTNLFNLGNFQSLFDNQPVGTKHPDSVLQVPVSAITQSDADNIIKTIVLNLKNEISEMKMKLHPENLGELNLKVRMEESKATVKIEVPHTAVKTIIESHMPQLRDSLLARGIDVQQIDIFTSGNSASFNNHKKQNDNPNNAAAYNELVEEAEESIKMLGYNTIEYLI